MAATQESDGDLVAGDADDDPPGAEYDLTLFVNGASDLSARAIANARYLCDIHLGGRGHLLVVDLHDNPEAVLSSQVLASPTLVKNLPLPARRIIGDCSHLDRVLMALDLPAVNATPTIGPDHDPASPHPAH